MTILLVLFFLILPLIISYLTQRYRVLNKIGAVLICYAIGMLLGHTPMFNESTYALQDNIASGAILLALPILLFDANPRHWKATAGVTLKSMIIAVLALMLVVGVGHAMFGSKITEGWKIGAMLIGVYTGGTPNLASIKTGLDVSNDVYIGVHTMDTILSAIYLLFLMTIGKVWFRKVLKHYPDAQTTDLTTEQKPKTLKEWFVTFDYKYAALGLLISIGIAGVSAFTGLSLHEKYQMIVIILMITTLAIAISMFNFASSLKKAFPAGMYFIYVFSLAIATRANFYEIAHLSSTIFYYVAFVIFSTFVLHFIFSKVFGVDADTMMITSTALICSPPFVPVIAGTLNNKNLLIPGITVGVIGYAVGNYLGFLFAYILH
ncbi:DUF819 family protein [Saccharicrinis sp. FJH2]|uniref:DUF819 family protein n=1 Tax=Saccharicrinis sp. FJH65 TaxID=3344659 RepID=UPI0035F3D1CE